MRESRAGEQATEGLEQEREEQDLEQEREQQDLEQEREQHRGLSRKGSKRGALAGEGVTEVQAKKGGR